MEKYVKEMKAKPIDIEADKLVAIINTVDAKEFGLLPLDRIELSCPRTKRKVVCVVDTTTTMVREGTVGMFLDVQKRLKIKSGEKIRVHPVPPPESVHFIKKKLDGHPLNEDEIIAIVQDLHENKLSEIEAAGFVSAVYIHGFTLEETVAMTKALTGGGKRLQFKKKPILDKHCIGGTNGRATMIVVPIIAAAGYYIPKTSSRSITSSAGTADSMEVLANVSLSSKQIVNITEKTGGVIAWGGALDLAPVDDKIIKIEHPFALDPPGQIIASVMAKKASANAKYVVIDMPIGPDVKIQSIERAESMAKKFIAVGKELGMKVEAVLTDGTEPSGRAFGPALEAKLVLEILEGKVFDNLAQKSCELAGVLFEMLGEAKKGRGTGLAKEILASGKALEKMKQIIKAQGAKISESEGVEEAPLKKVIKATQTGEISKINVRQCALVARTAGAPSDKKAGVLLHIEEGDEVKKGQVLFEIHAENKRKMSLAVAFAKKGGIVDLEKVILKKFV